jgi:hypothetical protein
MSGFSLQWLIVPSAVVVVGAALLVHPESGAAVADTAASVDPEIVATSQQLDARQAATLDRLMYKEELIDRLIAGDLTLAEVADEFLRMNRDTPVKTAVRRSYHGSGDGEKSARNVLDFVRLRKLSARQAARVSERLHREFERTYGTAARAAD